MSSAVLVCDLKRGLGVEAPDGGLDMLAIMSACAQGAG
jgi:hypothetical protein